MKRTIKCAAWWLAVVLCLSLTAPAFGAEEKETAALAAAEQYLLQTVPEANPGSVGGEWVILGLARSGETVPKEYFAAYYEKLLRYVQQNQGMLSSRKYTEYSRTILALTALGKDPGNVGGFDLLRYLGDYDKVLLQGINGPVFALLALDAGGYDLPAGSTGSREKYLQAILSRQLKNGGFSLSGKGGADTAADADVTAMTLQALAKYRGDETVSAAVQRAVTCLSNMQGEDGSYASYGVKNAESTAQVLVALCELGIDLTDTRFVKNGNTVLAALLCFANGEGFAHVQGGETDLTATEQSFYALVALQRIRAGKTSFYDMTDVSDGGKEPVVQPRPVTDPEASFMDIAASAEKETILALARRGIVNGVGGGRFAPEKSLTRAEFSAIIVRSLGLQERQGLNFSDVTENKWYAAAVASASYYGLINGVGGGRFAPESALTRQQAALLIARAAKLCGMETRLTEEEVQQQLAALPDGGAAAWAREGLAFCLKNEFLPLRQGQLAPAEPMTREEMAGALCRLLQKAQLL